MLRRLLKNRGFKLLSGFLVFASVGLSGALARADRPHKKQHKDQYKRQVEQLEQAWRTAQINGDFVEMDKLLSDDYDGITINGEVVTKAQELERIKQHRFIVTKIDLDDLKVKLIGTTAVVTSLAQIEGTIDGNPIHGKFRYTRVYSRLPSGGWKITNFEATRVGQSEVVNRHHAQVDNSGTGEMPAH